MIVIDGYTLVYDKGRNKIVIGLPQTEQTATNTITPCKKRRIQISDEEEFAVLTLVKYFFEKEVEE